MLLFSEYEAVIFDCDGVILDSNRLKIEAMENTLMEVLGASGALRKAIDYFGSNFGKSRYHHVRYFLENIFEIAPVERAHFESLILEKYSLKVREGYLTTNLVPGVCEFVEACACDRYVASGSDQRELREVFKERGLENLFSGIFGSPTDKLTLVSNILKLSGSPNAILIGDSESDFWAAKNNGIDFIFFSPYSNVKSRMQNLSSIYGFSVLNSFEGVFG